MAAAAAEFAVPSFVAALVADAAVPDVADAAAPDVADGAAPVVADVASRTAPLGSAAAGLSMRTAGLSSKALLAELEGTGATRSAAGQPVSNSKHGSSERSVMTADSWPAASHSTRVHACNQGRL